MPSKNNKKFNAQTPFTLFFEGESVSFKNLEDFTKQTGYSAAIAYDMMLERDTTNFKGWSRDENTSNNDR